jgi:hypothetical protein
MTSYDKAAHWAMVVNDQAKTYEKIATFFPAWYWLSELYGEMVKRDEITDIKLIPSSRKLVYWQTACEVIPDKAKWIKILCCHAFYMADLINKVYE